MSNINHIAIIMDGNGRWGLKNYNSRKFGHKKGIKTVEKIIEASVKKNIKFLTLYTFSTENWRRPKYEINFLFGLLEDYLNKNLKILLKNNIKFKILGDINRFPKKLKESLKNAINLTKNNTKLQVNLALNYGSKDEILRSFKLVAKKITKKNIKEKIVLIDNFYKKYLGVKPKIAVIGLNPHCESILRFNEDTKIIGPVVKSLKKKINVTGPFPADTIFLENNRKKFDIIIGMYHDQVLTPIKTIFEYDAINITMGLPFLRVTPDHGPNEKMIGKNISNPISLIRSLEFLDKK